MKALIDLHTHALSSGHAYSTVKENIEYAKINIRPWNKYARRTSFILFPKLKSYTFRS